MPKPLRFLFAFLLLFVINDCKADYGCYFRSNGRVFKANTYTQSGTNYRITNYTEVYVTCGGSNNTGYFVANYYQVPGTCSIPTLNLSGGEIYYFDLLLCPIDVYIWFIIFPVLFYSFISLRKKYSLIFLQL